MDTKWCKQDQHNQFDCLIDFNDWLDGEEELAETTRIDFNIDHFSYPSKALFVGEKDAYDEILEDYRSRFLIKVLSEDWLTQVCGDSHWVQKNQSRLFQLLDLIYKKEVVPFIGAGISGDGGFPTWKEHLKVQARTTGLDPKVTAALIADGQYEEVINQIEQKGFREAFKQEIRDSFSLIGQIPESLFVLESLFQDTLFTTNYDRLLEQAYQTGDTERIEVIDNRNPNKIPEVEKISIIKLHGDIQTPQTCIMGTKQYDDAYGLNTIDLSLPIPKLLNYHFTNSSFLFLGCSLNNDRTVQTFEKIRQDANNKGIDLPQHFSLEQARETEAEISDRNNYLLKLGIIPIWFPVNKFDTIVEILKYAQHEMNYRKAMTPPIKEEVNS
jgi:NAD-dependent SIR2 family protein deacetylase